MPEAKGGTWKMELSFSDGEDPAEGFRRVSDLMEGLDDFLASVPGLDDKGKADLRLVCDEFGSNVVRHAPPRGSVRLSVEAETKNNAVCLRIRDDGPAFNPFEQPRPYTGGDLDKRQVGGLGIYLVRELFPNATYHRQNNWNTTEVAYPLIP